jgi:predicted flap endonuclease-1-like 5' DNA nuclease
VRTGWYEEVAVPDNPRHHDDGVAGADDLTRIGGIGSKIADRLYAAGILTYADLASRSADELSKLLSDVSGLSAGRLDTWRDEARELAAAAPQAVPESPAAESPAAEVPAGAPDGGQHYESFLVRVLLNEDGSVRRTTAQHIRTGSERHWPGLERQALPEFIETAIASAAPSSTAPAEPPPAEPPSGEPPPDQARQAEAIHGAPAEPVTVDGTPAEPVAVRGVPAPLGPARQTSSAALSVEAAVLRAAEPFTMTMTIDLAEPASHADRLAYSAVIVARPMAGGPKLTVAESDGLLATTSPAITIYGAGLPPGAYRLDGAVSLREPGRNQPMHLAALAEGLLVQVLPD